LEFGEGDDLGFGEFFGTIGVNFVRVARKRLAKDTVVVDANATKKKERIDRSRMARSILLF